MKIFNNSLNDIKEASELLKEGKLLAFPTETVFGVSCIYNNLDSYNKLNSLKRRLPDKPYTLMVKDIDEINKFALLFSKDYKFLSKFMPGSITVVLNARENLPSHIVYNGTIGIRIPTNEVALNLLNCVDAPILVPSLNRSGEKPLFKLDEIKNEFDKELDGIIFEEITPKLPSTVFSLINGKINLIREGEIKFALLKKEYESI